MVLSQVAAIFSSIVTVALVWVLVSNGNTANIIKAFGNAFNGGLQAATGR